MAEHKRGRLVAFCGLACFVYAGDLWLSQTRAWTMAPDVMEPAVIADFFLTVPLLYFFVVAQRDWRSMLQPLLVLSSLGLLIARYFIPTNGYIGWTFLFDARWLKVAAAIGVEAYLTVRLVALVRRLSAEHLPETVIRLAAGHMLGDRIITRLVSAEMLAWYYALATWRRTQPTVEGDEFFSYDRHDGGASLLAALCVLMIVIDLPLTHLLVWLWSPTAAWITTGLNAYGLLWLVAHCRAVRLRPVSLSEKALQLRLGLLWTLELPLNEIATVAPANMSGISGARSQANVARMLMPATRPNIEIQLRAPRKVAGPFGVSRTVQRIYLGLDEPRRFIGAVQLPVS